MIRLKVPWLALVVLLLAASAAGSQPSGSGGISFDIGSPQNEFRDNVDNTGIGGGGFAMGWIPHTPLAIGVSADIMEYGREDREAPWSTTIPDVFVDVSTTNNLAVGHLFLRVQPKGGFFQPYLEGLIGFNYLWTTTSVKNQGDDEEIASTKHLSDFAFSYGAGAGFMLRLWKPSDKGRLADSMENWLEGEDIDDTLAGSVGSEGDESKLVSVGIFTDVRYIRGGESAYLRKGSIEIDGGRVKYDVRHSRTDILIVRIGVSVAFM